MLYSIEKDTKESGDMKTKKLVIAALMAALACVVTMIVKVPSPLKGYVNLGDCIVLIAGWILSPVYAFMAAAIGSAMADVFSGYVLYAPATFAIKGLMALVVCYGYKLCSKKLGDLLSRIISGILAETFMVLGYYVFEGFLYGFIPSLVNIPANAVQGVAGLIIGVMLIKIFKGNKMLKAE